MAERAEELSPEGEKLLAATPEEFVSERARVARELRDAGRGEEARLVSELRKPPLVVLAVNRAARDRPQAARETAEAAELVREAQLSGDAEEYRRGRDDLERASALLAEVAIARLSREGSASEAMRRRVNDLLRAAAADDGARKALVRGALREEIEAPGFSPFEGTVFERPRSGRKAAAAKVDRRKERQRAREREMREELERAQVELQAAERRFADAERDRDRAKRAVESIRAKLDRL
jgi:hypothetical protein